MREDGTQRRDDLGSAAGGQALLQRALRSVLGGGAGNEDAAVTARYHATRPEGTASRQGRRADRGKPAGGKQPGPERWNQDAARHDAAGLPGATHALELHLRQGVRALPGASRSIGRERHWLDRAFHVPQRSYVREVRDHARGYETQDEAVGVRAAEYLGYVPGRCDRSDDLQILRRRQLHVGVGLPAYRLDLAKFTQSDQAGFRGRAGAGNPKNRMRERNEALQHRAELAGRESQLNEEPRCGSCVRNLRTPGAPRCSSRAAIRGTSATD